MCAVAALIPTEQRFIDELRPEYNLSPTAGSCQGIKQPPRSADARANISRAAKEAWDKRRAEGRIEREEFTEDHRARLSESQRNVWAEKKAAGWVSPAKSDEHRRALSEARVRLFANGYKMPQRTPEQCERYSEAARRKWDDPAMRARMCAGVKASYTPELRELRGRLSRERWSDPEYREAMSGKIRQAHKEGRMPDIGALARARWADTEYREQMLQMLRDRPPPSEEQRRRISETLTGRKMSVETKRKKSALTDEQASEVLHLRLAGKQYKEICNLTGFSLAVVQRVCRRERYQWVEPHIPPMIDTKRRGRWR